MGCFIGSKYTGLAANKNIGSPDKNLQDKIFLIEPGPAKSKIFSQSGPAKSWPATHIVRRLLRDDKSGVGDVDVIPDGENLRDRAQSE